MIVRGMVHGWGHLFHFLCLNATHNNCIVSFALFAMLKSNLLCTVHIVRDDECILWLLATPCCEKKCMRKLSVEDVLKCH